MLGSSLLARPAAQLIHPAPPVQDGGVVLRVVWEGCVWSRRALRAGVVPEGTEGCKNHMGKEQGGEDGEKRFLLAEAATETSWGDLWGHSETKSDCDSSLLKLCI